MADLWAIRTGIEARGLLREAARLYGRAALAGDAKAAADLVRCWHLVHPGDPRAARWAAESAPVDDPAHDAYLLRALLMAGADDEARHLAGRAVAGVRLDDPPGVAELVVTLREAGEEDQVGRLAERGAELASLDDPWTGVDPPAVLAEAHRKAMEEHAASPPAMPTTADVRLDDPIEVTCLLVELRENGELDQAQLLAARASPAIGVDNPFTVAEFLRELRQAGAADAAALLVSRDPAGQVRLDRPFGVRDLLIELHEAGAGEQVRRLAGRAAADTPDDVLGGASSIAAVLHGLWHAGAREQVGLLAGRAVGRISLDDTRSVAQILDILAEGDAQTQVAALLGRDLGMRVPPGNQQTAAALLAALRKAGADHQAEMLIQRLPEAGLFVLFREQPGNERLYQFGRDADGGPARAWDWEDVWQ
ncbi:hypothetical protein ACQEVZ_07170 [Dactylosporangium sp. CA-152071]|uniref:hypothetical protein n=1 Tax=Dactylosporangium sp. CA-152071 TaxID=3239933 RepID=UPI003D8F3AC8